MEETEILPFGWRKVHSPTLADLLTVEIVSPDDAWAGGMGKNCLLHYDGSKWEVVEDIEERGFITCIHMTAASHGWLAVVRTIVRGESELAIGQSSLYQFDGRSWTYHSPIPFNVNSIDIVNGTDGWAVGVGGIVHYSGGVWKPVAPHIYRNLTKVNVLSKKDIWAVGYSGSIVRYDGYSWTQLSWPANTDLFNIDFVSPNNGWAVGTNGLSLHFNGQGWEGISIAPEMSLHGIDMISEAGGWIVGDEGTILTFDGQKWSSFKTLTGATLRDVEIDEGGQYGWAVGDRGTILQGKMGIEEVGQLERIKREIFRVKQKLPFTDTYGISMGDVNGDGFVDIYFTSFRNVNHLLLNMEAGFFEDVTVQSRVVGDLNPYLRDARHELGSTMADIDNDGDTDIFLAGWGKTTTLFLNNGRGLFEGVTENAGIPGDSLDANTGIFGDVDNDGDLDIFITDEDHSNRLLLNDGYGSFKDVTSWAGLKSSGSSQGATFGDVDSDGDLDLYVPNFNRVNYFYKNDGQGRIVNEAEGAGAQGGIENSNAAVFADMDNDGDLDLFVTNKGTANRLYRNDCDRTSGEWRFTDISIASNVDYPGLSYGAFLVTWITMATWTCMLPILGEIYITKTMAGGPSTRIRPRYLS